MLVLIRKAGESLAIGDDIRITVVEVNGQQVRLATEAPAAVNVLRQEVHQRNEQSRQRGSHRCREASPVPVMMKPSRLPFAKNSGD